MKVVVVAAGDLTPSDLDQLADATLVIAADGGAASLAAAGCRIDRLVGDLDSVDPAVVERLAAAGTSVERHPTDKEASDTELAVRAAIAAGVTSLVVLGATGGDRLDHELANLLLLADPALGGVDAVAIHGGTTIRVVRPGERRELGGRIGDLVTLLPIGGDAGEVTTGGLRWPLEGATLHIGGSRGLSNEVVIPPPWVTVGNGMLLVVETCTGGASIS